MRIYRLCCIHELPSEYADLVDEDYFSPVVVQSAPLDPNPEIDEVIDGVLVCSERHSVPRGYMDRYGHEDSSHLDFHVHVDEEPTEETCAEVMPRLNGVLEKLGLNYRFIYDPDFFVVR
jgi:hypothetical protein